MAQLFQHDNAAAAANDESIAVSVKCAGCFFRRIIVFRRHGPHRIKQTRQRPIQFFATARKHHILLAEHDLLCSIADAMQ